jgi:hypothetical protein
MAARGQGAPGADLTIVQNNTAMTLAYRDGTKFTYTLDGSASRNVMHGRNGGAPVEQVATARWAGNTIVVTTATTAGNERRTFSMQGEYLVVETTAPAPSGGAASPAKVAYQPYVRGFGG